MTNARRDDNRVPTLLGVSSADGITPIPIQVNPVTGRMLAEAALGGGDMTKAVYDPANIAEQLVGLTAIQTLTNKTLTSAVLNIGVSGTAVLDEDDMHSDSNTQLATQQSIKAYVDNTVVTLAGKDYLTIVGQQITANAIDLADDVTGILPIANGGTNSSTALGNGKVMVSDSGAIIESATITTTELGLLNGIASVSTGVGDNDKFVTQGYVDDAVSGVAIPSLQSVFDVGQSITIADTDNQTLAITNNDVTNNPDTVTIANAGTGHSLYVNQSGVLTTDKHALYIYSNAAQVTSELVEIHQDNASSTHQAVQITNDGTGGALWINQVGILANAKTAFQVVSQTDQVNTSRLVNFELGGTSTSNNTSIVNSTNATGNVLYLHSLGVLAADRHTLYVYSEAIQVNSPLIYAHQDNASSTADVANIINDGTGNGLYIAQNGVLASPASALKIYSNAAQDDSPLVYVELDNASASHQMIQFVNKGTGHGLIIDQAEVLDSSNYGLYVYSGTAQTNSPLVYIYQDSASSTQSALSVRTDGAATSSRAIEAFKDEAGVCLDVAMDGTSGEAVTVQLAVLSGFDTAIGMEFVITQASGDAYAFRFSGSEHDTAAHGATAAGRIKILDGAVEKYIYMYSD